MKILIDVQGAQTGSRQRGIGRYVLAMTLAMLKEPRGHEMSVLLNGAFADTIDDLKAQFSPYIPASRMHMFFVSGPVEGLVAANAWRQSAAEIQRQWVIDSLAPDMVLVSSLFEGAIDDGVTSIEAPPHRVPTACVLYDLIPLSNPERYMPAAHHKSWYYAKLESLKNADVLLAISGYSKEEAHELLGLPEDRIAVISSAASDMFSPVTNHADILAVLNRLGITRRFIMHTSAFEPRKNFEGLIRAFALIPAEDRAAFQLVFVTSISPDDQWRLRDMAASLGLIEDDVILAGHVSDLDLVTLYSECEVFAFPPFHEGFGLPALEAMRCGAPAIGSNLTSIPEVIGWSEALFDPFDDQSVANLLRRVMVDSAFRDTLREHASRQAARFTWEGVATRAFEAIEARVQPARPVAPATTAEYYERMGRLPSPSYAEDLVHVANAAASTLATLEQATGSSAAASVGSATVGELPFGVPVKRYDSRTAASDDVRILLLKLDHIGDFLISLEAFGIIRSAWPKARITLVCGPWNADLAQSTGLFDDVVACRFLPQAGSDFDAETVRREGLANFLACNLDRFDIAADLRYYPDSRFLLDHVDVEYRVGYTAPGVLLDLSLPEVAETGIRAQVGARVTALAAAMVWTYGAASDVPRRSLLRDAPPKRMFDAGPIVGIAPGAGNAIKSWGIDRFAVLAERLTGELDCRIVLIGGEQDAAAASVIASRLPPDRVRNLAGGPSLAELSPILAGLDVFIGNDTGTTHFAAALDVATLCLFSGQSHVDSWRPRGDHVRTLKGMVHCSPCYLTRLEHCPRDHWCMEISPDRVFSEAVQMLPTATRPQIAESVGHM